MPPAPDTTLRLSIRLDGRPCSYVLGRGVLSLLPTLLGDRPAVVLLDRGAVRDRREPLTASLRDRRGRPLPTLTLSGGEGVKSLATLERVYAWLARRGLPRDGTLVGVGGGALLDLAGFAAATWQRGVDFVSAPTTLLAMVDASLGGKTALDVAGVKNNVGAFHPAIHVLADPGFLATLPRREWRGGLAETIKAAVIASPSLFANLERHAPALRAAFGEDASPSPRPRSRPRRRAASALARLDRRRGAGQGAHRGAGLPRGGSAPRAESGPHARTRARGGAAGSVTARGWPPAWRWRWRSPTCAASVRPATRCASSP